jgi:hypothetical protein
MTEDELKSTRLPMQDINEAVYQLRRAFKKHGMNVAAIELASPLDGDRMKYLLAARDNPDRVLPHLGMNEQGDPRHQVRMQDIVVRWGARWKARIGGGWDYV